MATHEGAGMDAVVRAATSRAEAVPSDVRTVEAA